MIGSLPLSAPELESRITPALQAIEDRLMEVVTSADETINPPTSHLPEAGGKRLRPVLALLTAQLGDPALATGEEIRDAGVAVELTHIATLYHDDVMDEAPLRRGAPSAQTVWGNSAAILTGDVLVARASQLVAALGPQAVMAHAKTFERLCMGQLHETLPRPAGTDPVDHYIQVLADKTGSLIAVSARYGAMLTDAGARTEQIVEEFGERIGVAFQCCFCARPWRPVSSTPPVRPSSRACPPVTCPMTPSWPTSSLAYASTPSWPVPVRCPWPGRLRRLRAWRVWRRLPLTGPGSTWPGPASRARLPWRLWLTPVSG